MLAAAGSNAASGVAALAVGLRNVHVALHFHEIWILAASGALVAIGGALELNARRHGARRGFPWLFALSAACLAFNAAVIVSH